MTIRLTWIPRITADSQQVYRSTATFDKDSLPSVLATLGATDTEYLDETATIADQDYYYAIGTVSGANVALSQVVMVTNVGDSGASSSSVVAGPSSEFAYDELSGMTVDGAWGLRLMYSSYTGPLVRIRDAYDDSEQDVGYDSNGDLNSFTTVGAAKIVKVYDQSENANHLQPSNGGGTTYAPDLLPTGGLLSTPVIDFSGGTKGLELTTALAPAYSPLAGANPTWAFVCERTVAAGGFEIMAVIPNATNGWSSPFYRMGWIEASAAADVEIRDGNGLYSVFDGGAGAGDVWLYEARDDAGGRVDIYQNDGTSTFVTSSSFSGAKTYVNNIQLRIGMRQAASGSNAWNGKFYELCCMSGGYLSQAQRESLMEGYLVSKWIGSV